MSERKLSHWVVKNLVNGTYWSGCWDTSFRAAYRFASIELTATTVMQAGGKAVAVFHTTRKVKRPRKLTEAQRNAVAEYVYAEWTEADRYAEDIIADIRSGKAGL